MQNTIELINNYYDAFNRNDMDSFFHLLHDHVIHDINQNGQEIGKKSFVLFMQRMNHCYHETITNLIIMTNKDPSRAAAEFMVAGTYIATDSGLPEAKGQKYQLPGGAFFEIKDNKIYRITNYYNLNEWLNQIKK